MSFYDEKGRGDFVRGDPGMLHDGGELYLVCLADGTITFMSTALKLVAREDCTGRNLREFLPQSAIGALHQLMQGGSIPELPFQLGGTAFRAYISADGDGMTVSLRQGASAFSTSRRARMQEINQELSAYLSMMTASVDMIARREFLDEPELNALSHLRQNIFRILRLSRNLLDTALFENGELLVSPREGDLSAFIARLAERLAPICRQSGVRLDVVLPETGVFCRFDEEKTERIVLNLIAGAFGSTAIRMVLADRGEHAVLTVYGLSTEFSNVGQSAYAANNLSSGYAVASSFTRALGGTFVVSGSPSSGYSACITLPKKLERDSAPLSSLQIDYTGGFDHVLVELSTVLDKQFYR